EHLSKVDDFCEREAEYKEPSLMVVSAEDVEVESEIAGRVQVVRQMAPHAFLLVIISSKLNADTAAFVKKSGANAVLLEPEVEYSSKLEFIFSQKIKSSYIPIKASELKVGTKLSFPLYHLMPLNRKYLPVVRASDEITQDRYDKLMQVTEIYVHRNDVEAYHQYTMGSSDQSAEGLGRRCRAQFMRLYAKYVDLVMLISDQSESKSFKEGAALYEQCSALAGDLMNSLSVTGGAWNIINNSAIGEFGSLQRSPAVAAYAGLLSLHAQIGSVTAVMTAVMLADIGLLEVSPKVNQRIRKGQKLDDLHKEDLAEFHNHPVKSLNMALSRKLQIPENVKNIILSTHETADKKGFPAKPNAEKIPMEAMLIQYCEKLDHQSCIRMGEQRKDINEVKKQIFESELEGTIWSRLFLEKIRRSVSEI
ncbi:MAG: HD domain-containing phosphohydrolase, partial [Bdellovibrionales bacterium]